MGVKRLGLLQTCSSHTHLPGWSYINVGSQVVVGESVIWTRRRGRPPVNCQTQEVRGKNWPLVERIGRGDKEWKSASTSSGTSPKCWLPCNRSIKTYIFSGVEVTTHFSSPQTSQGALSRGAQLVYVCAHPIFLHVHRTPDHLLWSPLVYYSMYSLSTVWLYLRLFLSGHEVTLV